ncbi:TetR/AcrR family transcriptional regulator [Gordonia sp. DT30]|uniref:TetR/AcrR family transcriptional regulator n=1 Tax=Gordonia sp. DT30 TaxID=3416546 RepID=UPI003CF273CF
MTFDERRTELIDAAIRVIARDGLAAASTRAIVGEAGMPQGALFYIFSSREALISAVIEEITGAERLGALLSIELSAPDIGVDEVLTTAMDSYLRLLERDPRREIALLEVATHAMRHDPDAGRRQWATYRSAVADALTFIATTMQLRWSMPVEELAHMVTSSLDGLTLSWLTDRDSAAARRHIAVLATTFAAMAIPLADPASTETADNTEEHHRR